MSIILLGAAAMAAPGGDPSPPPKARPPSLVLPNSPMTTASPARLAIKALWRRLPFRNRDALVDAGSIAFITVSLLVYGVLQERIMTIGFGPHRELFQHSIFLVLCNRLVTCMVAFGAAAATGSDIRAAAPLRNYWLVSCTNVVATTCQYEALRHVSFAVQTLAKSAKAFPVMLWGAVVWGKRYRGAEYAHAGLLCAGCTIFVLGGSAASRVAGGSEGAGGAGAAGGAGSMQQPASYAWLLFGSGLMLLYLAVDGLTSTWQDSMFATYNVTIYDQVMHTTAFSTLLSFGGAVAFGQLLPALSFVLRHPDALAVILALSASSAAVQLLISYTIKRHGALVFATIMTTRQFVAILLSSLMFWTPLHPKQWLGMGVVFGAAYFRVLTKRGGGGGGGGRGHNHLYKTGKNSPAVVPCTPLPSAGGGVPVYPPPRVGRSASATSLVHLTHGGAAHHHDPALGSQLAGDRV